MGTNFQETWFGTARPMYQLITIMAVWLQIKESRLVYLKCGGGRRGNRSSNLASLTTNSVARPSGVDFRVCTLYTDIKHRNVVVDAAVIFIFNRISTRRRTCLDTWTSYTTSQTCFASTSPLGVCWYGSGRLGEHHLLQLDASMLTGRKSEKATVTLWFDVRSTVRP